MFDSWYSVVAIVCSIAARAVIPDRDEILSDFGIPFKLGRDNGPSFNSLQFRDYEKHMGLQHIWVTPYAPWTNWALHEKTRESPEYVFSKELHLHLREVADIQQL